MRVIVVLALLCLVRLGDGRRVNKDQQTMKADKCTSICVPTGSGCVFGRPMNYDGDEEEDKAFCKNSCEDAGVCLAKAVDERMHDDPNANNDADEELGDLDDDVADDKPAKVDCAGDFGEPTDCSMSCGGGTRWRDFVIKTHPENGGKACPMTKFEKCNTDACPVDCAGSYGGWGSCSNCQCSKSCGGGTEYRTFDVTTKPANGGKACPPKQDRPCNQHSCPKKKDDKKCFPADALVETPLGPKTMSDVKAGDLVRSVDGAGRVFFDTVYFFGHADASSTSTYVDVELQGDRKSLQLTQKHFLPICPDQSPCEWAQHINVYAQDLKIGDYAWVILGDRLDMHLVQGLSLVSRKGLYNPYTLNGKVVVNNIVASAHSNWVLDSWTPAALTQYLPAVYQALFLPGRWLYHVFGPVAADILDMNNPQIAPEKHGYGPEFLGSCVACAALAMWLFSPKRV